MRARHACALSGKGHVVCSACCSWTTWDQGTMKSVSQKQKMLARLRVVQVGPGGQQGLMRLQLPNKLIKGV